MRRNRGGQAVGGAVSAARSERRARTARKVARRIREVRDLGYKDMPFHVGRAKERSLMDCGKTGCKCGRTVKRPIEKRIVRGEQE